MRQQADYRLDDEDGLSDYDARYDSDQAITALRWSIIALLAQRIKEEHEEEAKRATDPSGGVPVVRPVVPAADDR